MLGGMGYSRKASLTSYSVIMARSYVKTVAAIVILALTLKYGYHYGSDGVYVESSVPLLNLHYLASESLVQQKGVPQITLVHSPYECPSGRGALGSWIAALSDDDRFVVKTAILERSPVQAKRYKMIWDFPFESYADTARVLPRLFGFDSTPVGLLTDADGITRVIELEGENRSPDTRERSLQRMYEGWR